MPRILGRRPRIARRFVGLPSLGFPLPSPLKWPCVLFAHVSAFELNTGGEAMRGKIAINAGWEARYGSDLADLLAVGSGTKSAKRKSITAPVTNKLSAILKFGQGSQNGTPCKRKWIQSLT